MLTTLREFVSFLNNCQDIPSDAYYCFELECSDELRDQIYSLADVDSAEPFRSAMHNLGFTEY
jgi:hypothetical protein